MAVIWLGGGLIYSERDLAMCSTSLLFGFKTYSMALGMAYEAFLTSTFMLRTKTSFT